MTLNILKLFKLLDVMNGYNRKEGNLLMATPSIGYA